MVDLGIEHYFSDGVYAKKMVLPAGCKATSHRHAYSHLSILAQGLAMVEADGAFQRYDAPACIEIQAGIAHSILAITDVVWFCIHATEEKNVAMIDNVLIKGR